MNTSKSISLITTVFFLIFSFFSSCKSSKIVEVYPAEVLEQTVEEIVEPVIEEKNEEIVEPVIEEKNEEIVAPVIEEKVEEIVEPVVEEVVEEIVPVKEEPKPAKKIPPLKKIDMTKWYYNKEAEVYYQLNIPYCSEPQNKNEKLAVYVPECYFNATKNNDNTYTVHSKKGSAIYTMDIDTRNDKMKPDSTYSSKAKDFMRDKRVLIRAGGESSADFKAAIRYIRYNADLLPGGVFGMFVYGSFKGAEYAAVLGSSANSKIFMDKLNDMGAAKYSDAVQGVYLSNPDFSFDIKNKTDGNHKKLDKKYLEQSIDRLFSIKNFPFQSKIKVSAKVEPEKPVVFQAEEGLIEGRRMRQPKRLIPDITAQKEFELQKAKREREMNGLFDTRIEYMEALNSLCDHEWIKYDQFFKTVEITDLEGFNSILNHLKIEEGFFSDGANLEDCENPVYFFEEHPEIMKATYWVIKSAAFKSMDKSAKEQYFLQTLLNADCESFLDLVWEKTEGEDLSLEFDR